MNLVPAQLITCDYKPEGDSHLQNSAFSRCCSCALTSPFQSGNSVVLSMVRVMQPTLMSQFRAFPSPQKEIPLLRPPPPHPLPQPLWLLLCSVPWICCSGHFIYLESCSVCSPVPGPWRLRAHPFCSMGQYLIPFYGQTILPCVARAHFVHPFIRDEHGVAPTSLLFRLMLP